MAKEIEIRAAKPWEVELRESKKKVAAMAVGPLQKERDQRQQKLQGLSREMLAELYGVKDVGEDQVLILRNPRMEALVEFSGWDYRLEEDKY